MKYSVLALIVVLTSFFSQAQEESITKEERNKRSKTILYNEYHEAVEGDVSVILVNSDQIKCGDSTFMQVLCDTRYIRLNVMVSGMSIRSIDASEGMYAITPTCKEGDKSLMISYKNEEGQMIQLARVKLDIVYPEKEDPKKK